MTEAQGYIETLTGVTTERLGEILKSFEADGAIRVEHELQTDGKFTVHAYFRADEKTVMIKKGR